MKFKIGNFAKSGITRPAVLWHYIKSIKCLNWLQRKWTFFRWFLFIVDFSNEDYLISVFAQKLSSVRNKSWWLCWPIKNLDDAILKFLVKLKNGRKKCYNGNKERIVYISKHYIIFFINISWGKQLMIIYNQFIILAT